MNTKSERAMKITLGIVGGALAALMMLPSGGAARVNTVDDAARALLYGKTDAHWTATVAKMAAADAVAARQLGRLAESANVDSLQRARVLDALEQAATPAADAALFQALCTTSARNDGTYPLLVAGVHGAPSRQGRASTGHKR